MGVRGLTTYLSQFSVGSSVELKSCQVVIDCGALLYYLLERTKLDKNLGGETLQFHHECQNFLARLKSYDVHAVVVSDGCFDSTLKEDTAIRRMNDRMNASIISLQTVRFSPSFHYERIVFQVCQILGFDVLVSKREADRAIALFANYTGAYILSKDSDFYIYNCLPGFISMNSLVDNIGKPLTGTVVTFRDIAKTLDIKVEWLGMFAILAGNDNFDTHKVWLIRQSNYVDCQSKLQKVINFMKRFSNKEEAILEFEGRLDNILLSRFWDIRDKVMSMYDINSTFDEVPPELEISAILFDIKEFRSATRKISYLDPQNQLEWIDGCRQQGLVSPKLALAIETGSNYLDIPVQDFERQSVHTSTLKLRQVIYSLLTTPEKAGKTVVEFDRRGRIYGRIDTIIAKELSDGDRTLISKSSLDYLCRALGLTKPEPIILSHLEDPTVSYDLTFLVVVLNYLVLHMYFEVPPKIQKIFLLSILINIFPGTLECSSTDPTDVVMQKKGGRGLLHLIGLYTSTMNHMDCLNELLGCPMVPLQPKYWFNGACLYALFTKFAPSFSPVAFREVIISAGISYPAFCHLYKTCFREDFD